MTTEQDRLAQETTTEFALLGAILLRGDKMAEVAEIIQASDFADRDVRACFSKARELWKGGILPTAAAVAATIGPKQARTAWEAQAITGTDANILYLANHVKDASSRRKMRSVLLDVVDRSGDNECKILDLAAEVHARMNELVPSAASGSVKDDISGVLRDAQEASENSNLVGVPTGFRRLDGLIGGLQKTDLDIIAARPSVGKTALMLNIVGHILFNTDFNPAVFSAEMCRKALIRRQLSGLANIDNMSILRGDLADGEKSRLKEMGDLLARTAEGRLLLDDKPRPTPGYILSACKSFTPDVVFVDYLQIMGSDGRFEKGHERLEDLTRSMKNLAKQLEIPVVLLSQIRRSAEGRESMAKPSLDELKGSGAIEEDADIVVMVHRATREARGGKLIVAKNRNGPVGEVDVSYSGPLTTFWEN